MGGGSGGVPPSWVWANGQFLGTRGHFWALLTCPKVDNLPKSCQTAQKFFGQHASAPLPIKRGQFIQPVIHSFIPFLNSRFHYSSLSCHPVSFIHSFSNSFFLSFSLVFFCLSFLPSFPSSVSYFPISFILHSFFHFSLSLSLSLSFGFAFSLIILVLSELFHTSILS